MLSNSSSTELTVTESLSLYVHIPFCETRCPYCDFNTYSSIEALMPAYVEALAREITQWGVLLGSLEVGTVFFGGGTPSYLPAHDLSRLMETIAQAFHLRDGAELTLEANPDDMDGARAEAMRRAGFNRVSIGVQSLDDHELQLLGRRHTANQAKLAARAARQAGFDNLSLDLMFGLPLQTLASWRQSLEEVLEESPDHLSLYALTLEPGTPMEADVRLGRIPEPDPDLAADMYELAQRLLASAGYQQYEVSNWAMPEYTSRHNLTYWRNRPYLGFGPGAHSYLFANGHAALGSLGPHGVRFASIRPPRSYISRATQWNAMHSKLTGEVLRSIGILESVEMLDDVTAMGETMMMGLRLNEGVSNAEFQLRFGSSIEEVFPQAVTECLELGLLTWDGDRLRLTDGGRLLGNEAFQRFIAQPA